MAPIFGDLIAKLTGGGSPDRAASSGKPQDYRGFTITPQPRQEGGQWLTAGIISKDSDDGGGVREQAFIRADRHSTREDAEAFAVSKAKQIIDEQGESLFDRRS